MSNADYSKLPPDQRPAIGECVRIQLQHYDPMHDLLRTMCPNINALEGIVKGYGNKKYELKHRRILVEIKTMNGYKTFQFTRADLLDAEGNSMPDYMTEQEMQNEEIRKTNNREQYNRLEKTMQGKGYNLEDYLRHSIGEYRTDVHSADIEKLKFGEGSVRKFFDEDICEGLGLGIDWILYGDEKAKDHPCGNQVKRYLNSHPERREIVWQWMEQDRYYVEDVFEEYHKRDYYEFGEGEGVWDLY